jgi:hypothetical protein
MEIITLRFSLFEEFCGSPRLRAKSAACKMRNNAAFTAQPQGSAVTIRFALYAE